MLVLYCHRSRESCSAALVLCDDPVDIDNGTVTFNGNLIGDRATYICDSGFQLIGDAITTCTLVAMDSGEFQPAPPFCRREYAKLKLITPWNCYLPFLVACVYHSSKCSVLKSHLFIDVYTCMCMG